jgi:hypothetical protein
MINLEHYIYDDELSKLLKEIEEDDSCILIDNRNCNPGYNESLYKGSQFIGYLVSKNEIDLASKLIIKHKICLPTSVYEESCERGNISGIIFFIKMGVNIDMSLYNDYEDLFEKSFSILKLQQLN